MDPVNIVIGVVLIGFGIIFMLVGLVGLVVRVINELPRATGGGAHTLDVNIDLGSIFGAIITALANAPAHIASLVIGLVLIYFGLRAIGVEVPWPGGATPPTTSPPTTSPPTTSPSP